jgi:hypothetical protein
MRPLPDSASHETIIDTLEKHSPSDGRSRGEHISRPNQLSRFYCGNKDPISTDGRGGRHHARPSYIAGVPRWCLRCGPRNHSALLVSFPVSLCTSQALPTVAELPLRNTCCLTLHSSGPPTALRASRQAQGLRPILRLPSGAQHRRGPLNSNVRHHKTSVSVSSR